jgi:iron complex transport system substrate-binding protein
LALAALVAALVATTFIAGCTSTAAPGFNGPASPAIPSEVPTAGSAGSASGPSAPAPSPTATPAFPVVLTDDEGIVLKISRVPMKIVSLTPATTETLFAIGAGDRVVATTDFDDYPPGVASLPHVASFSAIDIEKIVGLGADLVVAGGNGFNPPDQIAKLRSLGIPVLVVYARDVPGVLRDIELVGQAVGRADAARDLTASMEAGFDQVRAATAAFPRPRTFYEIDATGAIYGPADQSFLTGMITLAGGDPITTGDPNTFDIPLEKLVAADPEVIVLGDAAYGATPALVKARPGWATMTALKTGAIRPADDIVISRPGPRLVDGLRDLAIAIHPELAAVLAAPSPPAAPSTGSSGAPQPASSASGAP